MDRKSNTDGWFGGKWTQSNQDELSIGIQFRPGQELIHFLFPPPMSFKVPVQILSPRSEYLGQFLKNQTENDRIKAELNISQMFVSFKTLLPNPTLVYYSTIPCPQQHKLATMSGL